jgi:hypothetical protein
MASGQANRANRPNTWLHRPTMRREVLTCQPGAVHTWHVWDMPSLCSLVREYLRSGNVDVANQVPSSRASHSAKLSMAA